MIKRPESRGNKSPVWKGKMASYFSKHQWVQKWKGKANYCEMCGVEGKKKYEWANIDHTYRRVLEDYIPMCSKCHDKYDKEHNGTITGRPSNTTGCKEKDCKREHCAMGYCKMHYEKRRRLGDFSEKVSF